MKFFYYLLIYVRCYTVEKILNELKYYKFVKSFMNFISLLYFLDIYPCC